MSYTVDGDNRKTIGNGMCTLRNNPSVELAGFFVVRVTAFPADGGRIN